MKRIVIDIKTGQVKGNIDVVENDNKSDVYKIYILKNKAIYDLTDKTPRMVMIDKKQNIKQVIDLNVTDAKRGEVSLQVSDAWSREDGKYICQLAIFGLEGFLEQSTYFWITIKNSLFNDIGGEIIADPQFEMLKQELEKLQMALAKIEEWDKYFEDTSGKIEEKYTERLNEINSKLSENTTKTNLNTNKVKELESVKATKTEVEVERKRIDLLTKIENGQTEGNTELLDIRIGEDGVSYDTAGQSVRNQIKKVNSQVTKIENDIDENYLKTRVVGKNILNTNLLEEGLIQDNGLNPNINDQLYLTPPIKCKQGERYIITVFNLNFSIATNTFNACIYKTDAREGYPEFYSDSYKNQFNTMHEERTIQMVYDCKYNGYLRFNFRKDFDTVSDGVMIEKVDKSISEHSNFEAYTETNLTGKYICDKLSQIPGIEPKIDKDIILPRYIYVTCNDITNNFNTSRQYSTSIYLDHLLNIDDESAKFKKYSNLEGDRYYILSDATYEGNDLIINNNNNVDTEEIKIEISSSKYNYNPANTFKRSTKASLSKNTFPKVLIIGDSITAGVGATDQYGNGEHPYWAYIRRFFEYDKIDGGNHAEEYNFISLGRNTGQYVKIDYKDVNKNVFVGAEGYSGWTLGNILHHSSMLLPSQETWDKLGLGDGTHKDFVGTPEQKRLIAITNENNPSDKKLENAFFDNGKVGSVKFSIQKWLENYRTCEDDGTKLTLSSPNKGKYINSQNLIDWYDVCMPTHIIFQLGRNDLAYNDDNTLIENYKMLIADIKEQIPDVVIGICITPDFGGTLFPERYQYILGDTKLNSDRKEYDCAKKLIKELGTMEDERVFLIPNYFVQPTAWGFPMQELTLEKHNKIYKVLGDYPKAHQGSEAHLSWAYQIYSWLKYVLTLY